MVKLVNVSAGRRDGVSLLLATLQGIRGEKQSSRAYEMRLKELEGTMKSYELQHVREMLQISAQREQFAIQAANAEKTLDFNMKQLEQNTEILDDKAKERQVEMLKLSANMANEMAVIKERELVRKERNTQLKRDANDQKAIDGNSALSYIAVPLVDVDNEPVAGGQWRFTNQRMASLYESLNKQSKNFQLTRINTYFCCNPLTVKVIYRRPHK